MYVRRKHVVHILCELILDSDIKDWHICFKSIIVRNTHNNTTYV